MNPIETALFSNIETPNTLFVFPTDIAVSRWADHLLRLKGGTIAMNKFIAWDKFKQKSIKAKVQGKRSIPSALRKIFVSRLIKENSQAVSEGKTPVFSSLIRIEWAQQAQQFTSWLTGILPQLGAWFYKTTGFEIDNILNKETDKVSILFKDDEIDMYILAKRYALFLEEKSLFEPAWEKPPFNNDGMNYFIFFPEALSDFCEYRELLSASDHVKIISASNTENLTSHTFYYTNARREITEAALYIHALAEKQNMKWDSIAVCLPDSQNYEPYVLREFTNRNIPFVKRTSKPLTDFPAGQFFRSVIDCASADFAFSPLIGLILNKNLPWKDTLIISGLVSFGIKNNCISSWTEEKDGQEYHINIWEDALKNPFGYIDNDTRRFFSELKRHLTALRSADSFFELRKQYFIFRELFFDMEKCSEETDIVLSRCIAELMELTELEKNFPDVPAVDPFLFFCEYLSEVNYLKQAKTTGIAILPYKTAATAPFDCHIILGAAQNCMSVIYSRLYFLSGKKREELGIIDEDASAAFINFHKFNSLKCSAFFCSEFSFSGYEIPHSKLGVSLNPKEKFLDDPQFSKYFSRDYYQDEESENLFIHENQLNGFNEWKKRNDGHLSSNKQTEFSCEKPISQLTLDYIQKKLSYSPKFPGKISVSATALKTYYHCSLEWLYSHVLGLENVHIETTLMEKNLSGNVYHAVLDLFFSQLIGIELLRPEVTDQGPVIPAFYLKLLQDCIEKIFSAFPSLNQNESKTEMSSLSSRFLIASKDQFFINLSNFIAHFLSIFSGSRIISCEKWYQSPRDTYFLNGKTDCILKDQNGKYIIVDFKLGDPPKRKDCTGEGENSLSDLQLPMYISLTQENEKIEIDTALFYSIIKLIPEVIIGQVYDEINDQDYPKKEKDVILRDSEVYKQIFEEFDKKVVQFANELSTGCFSVFESDYYVCYKCKYSRICRKTTAIKTQKTIFPRES
jgi:hypothetical protein